MVLKVFKGGARPVTGTSQVFIGGALPRQIARYNCTNTAASDIRKATYLRIYFMPQAI